MSCVAQPKKLINTWNKTPRVFWLLWKGPQSLSQLMRPVCTIWPLQVSPAFSCARFHLTLCAPSVLPTELLITSSKHELFLLPAVLRAICCSPDIHKLPDISQPTCSWVGPCDQFCWVSCELKWHVAEELGADVPSSSFLFYSCSHGGRMLRQQNHRLEEPGCWVSTRRPAVFRELPGCLCLSGK